MEYLRADVRKYLERFDEILKNMSDEMLSQNVTRSITVNFIRCMVPHHEAAIYMCQNLLEYTKYQKLQEIANTIIEMQTKGIQQMKRILMTTRGYINSNNNVNSYMKEYLEITKNMIENMKSSPRYNNININFINEMIPHHKGAIEMCNNLLKYWVDPRLKKVAEDIIKEQSKGVTQLEEIRKNLYR